MANKIIWLTPDRFDLKPDKSTWIEMVRALKAKGYDVILLTSKSNFEKENTQEYDKFTTYVKPLDLPYIFRFSVLLKMFTWLKTNASASDIIIINQDALLLVPLLRMTGIRNIHLDIRTLPVDTHTLKDRLDKLLYWYIPLKLFGRAVKGYSFITERLKQELDKEFNLNVNNFAIWQSGVSTDTFYPKTENRPEQSGKFRLFYHGTISINRGIGLVIEAMSMINKETEIEFIIIGTGSGLEELKQLTNRLNVDKIVDFRGFMPYENMVDEINKADICICPLPDRMEWNVSSPIKVFEYMACGKPMILTPIPAHKDVANNSTFVVWTEGYKPEDFYKAILDAIQRKEDLAIAARSAPDIVKSNYEWRNQAEKLEKYIGEIFN